MTKIPNGVLLPEVLPPRPEISFGIYPSPLGTVLIGSVSIGAGDSAIRRIPLDPVSSAMPMSGHETPHAPESLAKSPSRYEKQQSANHQTLGASPREAVCLIALYDNPISAEVATAEIRSRYPDAAVVSAPADIHHAVLEHLLTGYGGKMVESTKSKEAEIPVIVRGTAFQRRVWQALSEIASGERITYSQLGNRIAHPKASRAVGTAVGQNPVSILIPCHRIVRADGQTGNYHWGPDRKKHILAIESA